MQVLLTGTDRDDPPGPKTAARFRAFAAEPEPRAATEGEIDALVVRMAGVTATRKGVTVMEVGEKLKAYREALAGVPYVDLRAAYSALLKSSKFLPTPAEFRTAADRVGSPRKYAKSRAKHLAWRHDVEWRPPVEAVPVEELRALLGGIGVEGGSEAA